MSHVISANLQAPITDDFIGVWKLSRVMLAAGWKYRSSGDATTATKDVSGVAGTFETAFASDKWGVDGGVNLATNVQTGTVVTTITANTDGTATIVFSGTTFTASSVGRFLNLAGDVNSGNNGTFRISAFTSATNIKIFNPGAVTEASPTVTSWHEQEGSATGTISTAGTSGAAPGHAIFTITGSTPFVAPTTSPTITRGTTGDRLTIIGAAVANNNGTFIITRVISTSSVEITNPNATSSGETNNGSLHWVECSPTAQSYPASITTGAGSGAWWNAQGPSMMKILIGTATVTGAFVRGEVVTQTSTGATGTVIGVLPDTVNGLGYMVIEPRLNGTGAAATGPRGWNNTGADTVTAAAAPAGSGASVATTTGPIEYVQEVVFWKNSAQNGHWWVQCVDQSAESTSRFSQIASTSVGVTNTIAPGGATATFPIPGSWVVGGTANSNAASTGSIDWYQEVTTSSVGLIHITCANCIATATTSADGSFLIMAGTPSFSASSYVPFGWQRCDDSEDGDVIPYVALCWESVFNYSGTRTVQTSTVNSTADYFRLDNAFSENTYTGFRGWRRRGFATGDAFQEFGGFTLQVWTNTTLSAFNPASTCHIQCTFSTTPVFVREPIWVASAQATQRMRKGTFRWIYSVEGAVSGQTYGAGSWVAVSAQTGTALVIGPWDGQSVINNG